MSEPSLTEVTVFNFFSLHIFFVLFPLSTAYLQTQGQDSKDNSHLSTQKFAYSSMLFGTHLKMMLQEVATRQRQNNFKIFNYLLA